MLQQKIALPNFIKLFLYYCNKQLKKKAIEMQISGLLRVGKYFYYIKVKHTSKTKLFYRIRNKTSRTFLLDFENLPNKELDHVELLKIRLFSSE